MSSDKKIILHQYKGISNIPSSNPFCMSIHAYLKFLDLEFEVNDSNQPYMSQSGDLPVLQIGNEFYSGRRKIFEKIESLKKDKKSVHKITQKEKSDLVAYASMVERDLNDVLEYNQWVDTDNSESTKNSHANLLPFPVNHIVPEIEHHKKTFLFNQRAVKEPQIYDEAEEFYAALSDRLGIRTYFFEEEKPSALDAIIFGHLVVHLYCQINDNKLSQLISKFNNLVVFTENILKRFFNVEPKTSTQRYIKDKEKEIGSNDRKWLLPFALFGCVAFYIWRKNQANQANNHK
eukprot:TRINITY_DN6765_c0_g1_i1.p1 TRINITY_DN6765_c0_g1~~TRINITY_DN6765_c0_g1_i1.p1  ORF type:complete len:297 (-),score=78.84 TRINITY_DN6765_c0_g1_i1:50-919(-)